MVSKMLVKGQTSTAMCYPRFSPQDSLQLRQKPEILDHKQWALQQLQSP